MHKIKITLTNGVVVEYSGLGTPSPNRIHFLIERGKSIRLKQGENEIIIPPRSILFVEIQSGENA